MKKRYYIYKEIEANSLDEARKKEKIAKIYKIEEAPENEQSQSKELPPSMGFEL